MLLCGLTALLIVFAGAAKEGARTGMALCEHLLIPSLLPMMILANTLIASDADKLFSLLLGKGTEQVLHLPRAAAGAVVCGLTCGYPTGAILTAALCRDGRLSRAEACRLMRFNLSGGLAFTVTAVGSLTYRSAKTGVLLFLINTIAALLCGIITGLCHRRQPLSAELSQRQPLSVAAALPDAVTATVRGLAILCGFIVFFSAVAALLPVPAPLLPLLEITKGVCQNESLLPLPYAAFFLSFGGLCLHLQLIGYLRQIGMRYLDFLTGRIACAALSFALGKLFAWLFPADSTVFCNLAAPQGRFSEGGIAFGALMMAGCAIMIADLKNRKLKSA